MVGLGATTGLASGRGAVDRAAAPTPGATRTRLASSDLREAEARLAELGYWAGKPDGTWDTQSRLAMEAFQKVEGRDVTGRVSAAELEALREASRPEPLETGYAHVEVDLSRQVLFFVDDDGVVTNALPVSSGSDKEYTLDGITDRAYTPRGRFTVYKKIDGWRTSRLGQLYYPCYLVGGIAIHGAPSVPAYPASHGCVRVPMATARQLATMIPVGTKVIVHDGGSLENGLAWLKK